MNKIIKLTSENVKRLQAVEITPDGNVIVIGGKNGQGKSSVLDSIQYALGGEPSDKMPVRRGAEKAQVILDLGDIVVKRTFTAGGGTHLVVTNADGVRQSTPQAILDKLVGKLTFDPLEFARQKPKEQAETLRALVGLDTTALDAERQRTFDERTSVNREVKALEARMTAMPKHDGVPEVETSTSEILSKQSKAAEQNRENEKFRQYAEQANGNLVRARDSLKATEQEIERLTKIQAEQKKNVIHLESSRDAADEKVRGLKDIDLTPFQKQAAEAETVNAKVRANKARADVVVQFKAKTAEAEKLSEAIEKIDDKKRKAVTDTKFPIAGMSFEVGGGVSLNGIPFEQCSSAEQLRVSVAIGLALNPKLRVLLIRDGSLLDEESLKLMVEMAKKNDAQVWLERVGTDAATSVIIEDGNVVEPEAA